MNNSEASKKELIFHTTVEIEDGQKITYCGSGKNGKGLRHQFAGERGKNGHCPGHVYLLALKNGWYKIGKTEVTKFQTDDFNLDEINEDLLLRLKERLLELLESEGDYNDYVFVDAIRVACGEGGEKHPQTTLGFRKVGTEMFALGEDDIEAFKNAKGELLDRCIKHVTAEEFGRYLDRVEETKIRVDGPQGREWWAKRPVVTPESARMESELPGALEALNSIVARSNETTAELFKEIVVMAVEHGYKAVRQPKCLTLRFPLVESGKLRTFAYIYPDQFQLYLHDGPLVLENTAELREKLLNDYSFTTGTGDYTFHLDINSETRDDAMMGFQLVLAFLDWEPEKSRE